MGKNWILDLLRIASSFFASCKTNGEIVESQVLETSSIFYLTPRDPVYLRLETLLLTPEPEIPGKQRVSLVYLFLLSEREKHSPKKGLTVTHRLDPLLCRCQPVGSSRTAP